MNQAKILAENIRNKEQIRENLSLLRQALRGKDRGEEKEEELRACLRPENLLLWERCLSAEDPKARKNAALLLGDLAECSEKWCRSFGEDAQLEATCSGTSSWRGEAVRALWEAYGREETLFVRPAYLKALKGFPAGELLECSGELRRRLAELDNNGTEAAETELDGAETGEAGEEAGKKTDTAKREPSGAGEHAKHLRQEKRALEELLEKVSPEDGRNIPSVSREALKGEYRLLLTADGAVAEKLAERVAHLAKRVKVTARGVMVITDRLSRVLELPLYQEAWFVARLRKGVRADREHLAEAVASSELSVILERFYPRERPFTFHLRLLGAEAERRRGDFLRKLADGIEAASGGRLRNCRGACHAQLILLEKQDQSFGLFVKITGMKDERFSYLRYRQPTSMAPVAAASMVALCEPYLKRDAQIIDPFCGVGTLLIERNRLVPAGHMYGTDIYGEAVLQGRENAALAGAQIYFVNRDFFDFTSDYLFDEIIGEFPRFSPGERAKAEDFYRKFFAAGKEILKLGGRMFLLSGEEGEIRKHLRLNRELRLLRQIPFRKTEKIYILEKPAI